MAEKKEFLQGRQPITFIDLFAGAGGISEGFLQAYTDTKYYDFVLASDISENRELTHCAQYNEQLALEDMYPANVIIDELTGKPTCIDCIVKFTTPKLTKIVRASQ